jgi:hypothetical protein
VAAADTFFAALAANNAAAVCSFTTPAIHAKWRLRYDRPTCVADLEDPFARPQRAAAIKANFSHASARLVTLRDGSAVVKVLGDSAGPPNYELELIDTAHGWLVNRAAGRS